MCRTFSGDDSGSVTILVVILAVGLMGAVGLVVDGGAKIRAAQLADAVAAEAARVGGQQIDTSAALSEGRIVANRQQARSAALAHLRASGLSGSVAIQDGGRRLVVTTERTVPTTFLGMLGLASMSVEGRAVADLVSGEEL